MTAPSITNFHFSSAGSGNTDLRAFYIEGQPWFVAKDVCDALGLSDVSMALARLDDDERAKLNLGQRGMGAVNAVSESGLYSLILSSRKPEARAFKKWVTCTVLPSLRQHGAYSVGVEHLQPDAQKALLTLFKQMTSEATRRHDKATQHDHFMRSGDKRQAHSLQQAERIGIEMGLPADAVFTAVTYGVDKAIERMTKGAA